jgi:hypothetical protein
MKNTDSSGLICVGSILNMTRQEYIEKQYSANRYLQYLSLEDLAQRTRDVLSNYHVLNEQCKIGLRSINGEGEYWFTLFIHIMTEMDLRKADFPDGFLEGAPLVSPTWPRIPRPIEAIKGINLSGDYLVKYGEQRYLRPMFEKGSLRIAPASSYNDPSLNQARKDSELKVSILVDPSAAKIELVDENTLKPDYTIDAIGNLTATLDCTSDYYVYCLSMEYNARLFDDFEADCCLIIHQPIKFVESLYKDFSQRFPSWRGRATGVSYYDPLMIERMPSSVFFHKHFRYAYQREYRIVLLPPQSIKQLEPFFIELGSLEEYCELICL